ncbi:ParA family protein [Haladaptatus sp. CMSO5]|uniref:ParA family protein n=1 Tax=Haladaptatus sp. CMSO5 TaxID=3120514 RepID=UPI002FCE29F8
MLTYTVYSEAGGVGKTTLSANLAKAHARAGQDVLVIDLDPQEGSLTYLLDVEAARNEGGSDNLVRHMIGRPGGAFEDLIRTAEPGIDVLPSHNMLERLTELLLRTSEIEEQTNPDPEYTYPRYEQLHRVLAEARIHETYDVLIVDPPATTGDHLYNAIYATRNVVIPLELSGKGHQSVEGLQDIVAGLESELELEVGVLAVVPNEVKDTADQREYEAALSELGFSVPVSIRDRTSLFEGCWKQQVNAFTYVEEHRSRKRQYELDTLAQFDELAAFINEQVNGAATEQAEVSA